MAEPGSKSSKDHAIPTRKVRLRASRPKTRSGCRTCKTRRVKCDEGKPACQRCIKFGTQCEGYYFKSAGASITSSSTAATIAPKPVATHNLSPTVLASLSTARSVTNPLLAIPLIQSAPRFEDERELASFLHFQQTAVSDISGTHDTSLWNHLILQSCRLDLPLRQLAASIGALTKAKRLRSSKGPAPADDFELGKVEELTVYAFRQYGRALKTIRQDATASTDRGYVWTRKAMIASILIYCFENTNGSITSAIFQMKNALRLMQKQFEPETRSYKHLGTTTTHQRLEQDLLSAFVRLDLGIVGRMLDDETGQTPNLSGVKPVPGPRSCILSVNFGRDVLRIPLEFSEVMEARKTIEYIQYWALPHLLHQFSNQSVDHVEEVDLYTKRICETIMAQLRQWKIAFQPLLSRCPQPRKGSKQHLALIIPRLQALSYGIALKGVYHRGTDVDLSPLNGEVREIIDMSKTVMDDPNFYRGFVFECEILPSLFIGATSCPGFSLRRESIELLKQTVPRQEAGWNSVPLVKIAEDLLAFDLNRMKGGS